MERDWQPYTEASWKALGREYVETLLSAMPSLEPLPTGLQPEGAGLSHIKAVLFDVYGTLLISASGDIEVTNFVQKGLLRCLEQAGVDIGEKVDRHRLASVAVGTFKDTVRRNHALSRKRGIAHPEVNIAEMWTQTVDGIVRRMPGVGKKLSFDGKLLALSYEVLANPVAPMPGMADCIRQLRDRKIKLGLISNAQFFTPLILEFYFQEEGLVFPFEPELIYFSYLFGIAKPDTAMFHKAARDLQSQGIVPNEVLYVGNDMRNDIWTAAHSGFRTALFAGDSRSLRLRRDLDEVASLKPDVQVTLLSQIPGLLSIAS